MAEAPDITRVKTAETSGLDQLRNSFRVMAAAGYGATAEILFAQVDRAQADQEAALAEAWDEGHADGARNEHEFRPGRKTTNPYRKEA